MTLLFAGSCCPSHLWWILQTYSHCHSGLVWSHKGSRELCFWKHLLLMSAFLSTIGKMGFVFFWRGLYVARASYKFLVFLLLLPEYRDYGRHA